MSKKLNLLFLLLIISGFSFVLPKNILEVEANTGFKIGYYNDEALTQEIVNNSKLKAGDYYIKLNTGEESLSTVDISIDSEGNTNDIDNAQATKIDDHNFKYKRTISFDAQAIGVEADEVSVNDTVLLIEESGTYYTDTVVPELELESSSNEGTDT
jgi:hypothetical protein